LSLHAWTGAPAATSRTAARHARQSFGPTLAAPGVTSAWPRWNTSSKPLPSPLPAPALAVGLPPSAPAAMASPSRRVSCEPAPPATVRSQRASARPSAAPLAACAAAGAAGGAGSIGTTHCDLARNGCLEKRAVPVGRGGGGGGRPAGRTRQVHAAGRDHAVAPGVHVTLSRQHHGVPLGRRRRHDALPLRAGRALARAACERATSVHADHSTQTSGFQNRLEEKALAGQALGGGEAPGAWPRAPAHATLPNPTKRHPTLGRAAAAAARLDGLHQARRGVGGGVGRAVAQLPLQVAAPGEDRAAVAHRHRVPVGGRHGHHARAQRRHPARISACQPSACEQAFGTAALRSPALPRHPEPAPTAPRRAAPPRARAPAPSCCCEPAGR